MKEAIPSIQPTELRDELQGPNPPLLLDVREAEELGISSLPGILHIPLGEIPERWRELDPDASYVVICRSGARSGQVVRFLKSLGFKDVRNLSRGMNGWAREVDPSLATY